MRVPSLVASAALAGTGYAQQAVGFGTSIDTLSWYETSPDGTKDEVTGDVLVQNVVPEQLITFISTDEEQETEQGEITEYRKKYEGIYDPNMFPYGPKHGDTRIPNADDAVSDPISLPSPFPLFGSGVSTDTFRATSNGLIVLDDGSVLESDPQPYGNNDIEDNFVSGFWNDIWSKKHGRMYMRIEQTNTTLLDDVRAAIVSGSADFGDQPGDGTLGSLLYAFMFSFWRVTHFGATKQDQKQNTFQMILTTDGTHSFAMYNYQLLEWARANDGLSFASAGYDVEGFNSGGLPIGSGSADVLDLSNTMTNSDMAGRHIFQLDDNPIAINQHPCDLGNPCNNGGVCQEDGVTYTCLCPIGFTGDNCDDIDSCASNNGAGPCQNGATCSQGASGAVCACPAGFQGDNCEDIDSCSSNNGAGPCQNGATCSQGASGAVCACADGFEGDNCENVSNPCAGNPCGANGDCNANGASFSCACKNGYSGATCTQAPDACAASPCANGSCQNNGASYTCTCDAGFVGANCDQEEDAEMPFDTNIFESQWPSNDNCGDENPAGCLGGFIGAYRPSDALDNGTCTITFPTEPAYFHIFDAHIRADVASTSTTWNICAANKDFEPGQDGTFRYLVYFAPGEEFAQDDVTWDCDSEDEFSYAVYSFPQNYVQKDGRSNIRVNGNSFDTTVTLSLGAQVANFTVDDPRINVNTNDNQNFVLTGVPETQMHEVWFQFEYVEDFFLSNTVGVTGSSA